MSRAVLGGACMSLQPLLLSAVALPATAYVIRTLGPTQYGQWAMAVTLVAVTMFLSNLGLRGAFVRAVAQDPASAAGRLAEQIGLRVVLCALAASAALSACWLLGYSRTVLLCTAVTVVWMVVNTVATTLADVLQAFHNLVTVAAVNTIAGLLLTGASVVAAYSGAGPVGVAASYLLGAFTSAALLVWIVHRRHFPVRVCWNVRRSSRLLWDARFFGVQLMVTSASNHAEGLLIPRLAGPTAFGFFSAGNLLAERLHAIPDGAGSAAYAAMADGNRRSGRDAFGVFVRCALLVLLACVGASVCVSLVAGPVARLLFPGRAEVCEQVMRLTIWSLPLVGVASIFGHALNALGRDAAQARATLAAAVIHLPLAGLLVWRFGITGACWSIILRWAVLLVILIPSLVRLFRPILAERPAPPPTETPPADGSDAPAAVAIG